MKRLTHRQRRMILEAYNTAMKVANGEKLPEMSLEELKEHYERDSEQANNISNERVSTSDS